MKSNYKKIGNYVRLLNNRNNELLYAKPMGININKYFMPSVANVTGTDLSKYKTVNKDEFAFNPMHVGRDEVLPIALSDFETGIIVSPAYVVFDIKDKEVLDPSYLMMWCKRAEFDREAWFYTDSSVRGGFSWEDFCNMELPVPSIEKQREIVKEYSIVQNNIKNNENIIKNLEVTAQAIYKEWFVDFNFPNEQGKPYKANGGAMVYNKELEKEMPVGWEVGKLGEICSILMGQSPEGSSYNEMKSGIPFFQGRKDFKIRYPENRIYCTSPKKIAKKGDVLMSVRAPVGDLNIAHSDCCIGRGLSAIRHNSNSSIFTHCLLQSLYSNFDKYNSEGTIFGSVNKDNIANIEIIKSPEAILNMVIIKLDKLEEYIKSKSLYHNNLINISTLILAKMSA